MLNSCAAGRSLTDRMTPEAANQLRKPFDPSAIGKLPKGGVMLDYVGHAATTDRLLSVDPLWTWEPMAVDANGLPLPDAQGNLWIRLTICGVTRIGVGDGKSAKERIGDAIRNAAMRFGVALDLWSKEELEQSKAPAPRPAPAQVAHDPDAPLTQAQVAKLGALFRDHGIKDRDVRLMRVAGIVGRDVDSSKDLTKAEASKVIDELQRTIPAQEPTP